MISRIITRMIPIVPRRIIEKVARRYIAGETAQDAVQAALRLKDKGYNVRISHLAKNGMSIASEG